VVGGVLLVLAVLGAWAQILGFDFTDVDTFALIASGRVSSAPDLIGVLSEPTLAGQMPNASFYRPATSLSLGADWALWGLWPIGYHLTDLVLHMVATLLLWLLLSRIWCDVLPRDSLEGRVGHGMALAAAALFAVYPVHAEIVPAIARRAELLVGVCLFACLLALWRRLHGGGLGAAIVATGACVLGLAAKETGLIIPAHAALLGVCCAAGGDWRQRLRQTLGPMTPLLAATAVYLVVRVLVLGGFGGYRMAGVGIAKRLLYSGAHHILGLGSPGLSDMWRPVDQWIGGQAVVVATMVVGVIACLVLVLRTVFEGSSGVRTAAFLLCGVGLVAAVHLPVVMVPRYLYVSAAWSSALLVWVATRGLRAEYSTTWKRIAGRIAGVAAAMMVASLVLTSPLVRSGAVDEWRIAGEVGALARSDAGRLVRTLPDGQTLMFVGFPYLVRSENALPFAPVLLEHSLQAWLDLRFPDRGHRAVGTSYLELDLRGWSRDDGPLPTRVAVRADDDGRVVSQVLAAGEATRFPWQRLHGPEYEGSLYQIEGRQRGSRVTVRVLEDGWALDPVFLVYLVDRVEARRGRRWAIESAS
jgi:hypothetical protein